MVTWGDNSALLSNVTSSRGISDISRALISIWHKGGGGGGYPSVIQVRHWTVEGLLEVYCCQILMNSESFWTIHLWDSWLNLYDATYLGGRTVRKVMQGWSQKPKNIHAYWNYENNLAKRTFPVSYAYFVFKKLYREVSSTLMLLELTKTRQTVSFDVWILTCLTSILPPRTGPQLSAFHF